MSQHKKQEKTIKTPQGITTTALTYTKTPQGVVTEPNPFTLTDPTELTRLLKAIYRDGATGTTRSLAKDVQAITDLVHKEQQ